MKTQLNRNCLNVTHLCVPQGRGRRRFSCLVPRQAGPCGSFRLPSVNLPALCLQGRQLLRLLTLACLLLCQGVRRLLGMLRLLLGMLCLLYLGHGSCRCMARRHPCYPRW